MEKIKFNGFLFSENQYGFLMECLTDDILERYNNSEYWNQDLIDAFCQDKKLKRIK